jgi:membrane protease YdiL (CAAX protease family)
VFTTPPPSPVSAASNIRQEISREERRRRWFELFLVLAISLGIVLLNGFYLLANAPKIALSMSALRSVYGIAHEALSLLLLAYVLSRRNLGLRDLGLRWSTRDILPGIGIAILGALSYIAGAVLLQGLHYELYGTIARMPRASLFFANPSLWALPFSLINPFFEELIVRAYVMTEIKELTGSTAGAIAFSVLLQGSYHLYYGWIGALSLVFLFLVFAIYYARTRQAVPIILAHALFDLYALIRLM